jgi:hypothetical protein
MIQGGSEGQTAEGIYKQFFQSFFAVPDLSGKVVGEL